MNKKFFVDFFYRFKRIGHLILAMWIYLMQESASQPSKADYKIIESKEKKLEFYPPLLRLLGSVIWQSHHMSPPLPPLNTAVTFPLHNLTQCLDGKSLSQKNAFNTDKINPSTFWKYMLWSDLTSSYKIVKGEAFKEINSN